MFRETLLESSPAARKRKRWPMAAAFTLEMIVASAIVIVPLLSTGVIPLSARAPVLIPLKEISLARVKPDHTPATTNRGPANPPQKPAEVVLVTNTRPLICLGPAVKTTTKPEEAHPGDPYRAVKDVPGELLPNGTGHGPGVKPGTTRPISVLSEAQLVNRVKPVYPKVAIAAGVQGQVKLHAIIARDGQVVSLNVISGHPLLVRAAEDAVSQWRYRPYFLNGEAVEVETLITVNFTREGW